MFASLPRHQLRDRSTVSTTTAATTKTKLSRFRIPRIFLLVIPTALILSLYSLSDCAFFLPGRSSRQYDSVLSRDDSKETAIIIATHPIPSHPSIDTLLETVESVYTYLAGLPPRSQLLITVDGLQEATTRGLPQTEENRRKFDLYLTALYAHFSGEHVTILVSGYGRGLTHNLKRAVEVLHVDTKYLWMVQHDIPFSKTIDHAALVQTAREYPRLLRIVAFNNRRKIPKRCGAVDALDAVNGLRLRKIAAWSDQNHFATVDHYRDDIFPLIEYEGFMEVKMRGVVMRNCSYYGPYSYYTDHDGPPYYHHLDASERYGKKLAERIEQGDVRWQDVTAGNWQEMRRHGINTTALFERVRNNQTGAT